MHEATRLDAATAARLERSINELHDRRPDLSARQVMSRKSIIALVLLIVALAAAIAVAPLGTAAVVVASMIAVYTLGILYKLYLFYLSHHADVVIRVTDEEARALSGTSLPVYTVLIPAFREPESIGQLLAAIDALEYPVDRLDVKLLLEGDDHETLGAARAAHSGPHVEIVVVPPAVPRTKPKALDYGLADARGEFVTIYDAEDVPEPLQLRRAVTAFARAPEGTACLQARLGFYNASQNFLTRWFTLEYWLWFNDLLPGILHAGAPVPLGGTSNHFRTGDLIDAGAWDPYNVTEDADLGIRLARLGHKVGLFDSETAEEATSDFVNWIKQRSRWYKGYFQTWLVHLRRPRDTYRELGSRGFLGFMMLIGGTPLLAVCNIATWALTLTWLLVRPGWMGELFPRWIYYLGLVCFIVGNSVVIYLGLIAARRSHNDSLALAALLAPFYWLMMSMAAIKATLQLVFAPSLWEKTVHGMAKRDEVEIDPTLIDAARSIEPLHLASPELRGERT